MCGRWRETPGCPQGHSGRSSCSQWTYFRVPEPQRSRMGHQRRQLPHPMDRSLSGQGVEDRWPPFLLTLLQKGFASLRSLMLQSPPGRLCERGSLGAHSQQLLSQGRKERPCHLALDEKGCLGSGVIQSLFHLLGEQMKISPSLFIWGK